MPRHAKAKKFKRNLSQNEQPNQSDKLLKYRFKAALILKVERIQGISSLLCY